MSRRSSSFAPAVHLETASPDVTAGHAGPPDEGGRDGQGAPWFFFINLKKKIKSTYIFFVSPVAQIRLLEEAAVPPSDSLRRDKWVF